MADVEMDDVNVTEPRTTSGLNTQQSVSRKDNVKPKLIVGAYSYHQRYSSVPFIRDTFLYFLKIFTEY